MTRTVLVPALSVVLLLASAGAARADVPPANSTECTNKNAGDSCLDDTMKPGACTESTCSELDYSHGSPPSTKSVPCLLCVAGDAPISSSGHSCALPASTDRGPWWLALGLALPLLRRRRAR